MDDTPTSSTPRPVLSALVLLASPAFLASLVACPGAARADAPPDSWTREAPAPDAPEAPDDPDPHAPLDDRALAAWDHFGFSMGFMGGLRRFDRMAFRGDAGVDPSLWRQAPFDGVQAYGLRYARGRPAPRAQVVLRGHRRRDRRRRSDGLGRGPQRRLRRHVSPPLADVTGASYTGARARRTERAPT